MYNLKQTYMEFKVTNLIILLVFLASCSKDDSFNMDCDCQLKTTYYEEVVNVFNETVTVSYSEFSDYGTNCDLNGVIVEDSEDIFSIVQCENKY